MAKRIPKNPPPEGLSRIMNANSFLFAVEVCIPNAPQIFTYGSNSAKIVRGSVVWVCLAKRKKPELALVLNTSTQKPNFKMKEAKIHASGYCYSERYMETLEWCAKYFFSSIPQTLNTFWPRDLEKYLNALEMPTLEKKRDLKKTENPELTNEQKDALEKIYNKLNTKKFQGFLLHGVTGSGKTRVYQELAKKALKLNKKILILVPEIGLTPQTAARFENFLGMPIAVLHSALSAPKKRESYVSILNGSAKVVLGTRSAILSPFDFDIVIIDEEHDPSFKQQDSSPRYHTRDLAYHIAYKFNSLVLLGSATPSLETYHNALSKNLEYLSLKNRATAVKLPLVQVINMRNEKQQSDILLSSPLREALTEVLQSNEQAIILMNRRGYSKARICTTCGTTLYCKHCKIPLVYHKQYHAMLCHYCHCLYPTDSPCFSCGATTFNFSFGAIEKLEEEILEWIPNAKVIRMDRDTTQNVGSTEKILTDFRERKYNILLGTQMVSKGHDFPFVSLVGIINADETLHIPDFRSGERLFQLLSQTAGRAGRDGKQGRVFIQTVRPEEPIIQFAIKHDYPGFAKEELNNRQLANYPPFCKFISIYCGSKKQELAENSVCFLEKKCQRNFVSQVLGPMEAPIPLIQNTYWMKICFKTNMLSKFRNHILQLLSEAKEKFPQVDFKLELE